MSSFLRGPMGLRVVMALGLAVIGMVTTATRAADLPGWQRYLKGIEAGAPLAIRAVVQTPDGFLWVGAANGLYRYDGVTFQRIAASSAQPAQSDAISALVVGTGGDLWAGHDWGGLSVVRSGRQIATRHPLISTVAFLRANKTGIAWSVSIGHAGFVVARLSGRNWQPWIVRSSGGMATQAVAGADGELWIIVDGRLFVVSPRRARMDPVAISLAADATLAVDSDGRALLVTGRTIQHLSSDPSQPAQIDAPVAKQAVRAGGVIAFDGKRAFWAVEGEGVLRHYDVDAQSGLATATGSWKSPYRLAPADLTQRDLSMIVDHEHNLWLGTSLGLERFSPVPFTTMLTPAADGTEPALPYALRDGKGTVWIRRLHDLFRVADDGRLERQPVSLSDGFMPCPSPGGGVWIPDGSGRLALFGGTAKRSVSLVGVRLLGTDTVGHCVEDGSGRVWANERLGLERLDMDRARMVHVGPQDDGYAVLNLIADHTGGVLAYVGRGSLWRSDGTRTRRVWGENAITLGLIEVMYQASDYLLLGGSRGLVRYDGRHFVTLTRERLPYLNVTTGIVQTAAGETWLQTDKGVVRMPTADLLHAFDDASFTPKAQVYDMADGLPGPVPSLNMSSITADQQGRIWVTTTNGIARFDPGRAPFNALAPPVAITHVAADVHSLPARPHTVLPAGSERIRIDFAGLSFVNPERVRFRYQLSGVDSGWVDAGQDRAAVYTNLAPGTYRFHVIAANNDGVWNSEGASINIELPARFYQTHWFKLLCVALILAAGWAIYRWRIGEVARRVRTKAADRADERERIARDIHDTLLQSIQGLVLRFQSIASRMELTDPNRSLMEKTLDRADGLIAEGKERVFGLRLEHEPADLSATLERALDEAAFQPAVQRSFTAQGKRRLVDSAVAWEAREIVGEALFNAARHAYATSVSIGLDFGVGRLEISVIDDGIGLTPGLSDPAAAAGFGLIGMRERAVSVGGTLEVMPGESGGTIVRLRVPSRRAYSARAKRQRLVSLV